MERIELKAQTRTVRGKQVKQIRSTGWTPAVLYGAKIPAQPIQIQERLLDRALRQAGTTSLINLLVDDNPQPHVVLAREIQRDAISGRLQHVDFYQVQLDHKVRTMLTLEVIGETPLIKTGGAILNQVLTQVEIECLPDKLVDTIPVDISHLETIHDTITIGDLPLPEGVAILADPEDVVVSLMLPRAVAAALSDQEEEEGEATEADEQTAD